MAKDVIHISEAEAASDFAGLMERGRAGAKVIIENGARPVAVLHPAEPVRRSISECIALANAHEEEGNKSPVLDPDFAEDVEDIIQPPQAVEPASVGIIFDSSILIAAQRGGESVPQIPKRVQAAHGETEAGLSVRFCLSSLFRQTLPLGIPV